jgi:hypothetical protein
MIEIALDLIFRGWCYSGEFTSLSAQNFESILHNIAPGHQMLKYVNFDR